MGTLLVVLTLRHKDGPGALEKIALAVIGEIPNPEILEFKVIQFQPLLASRLRFKKREYRRVGKVD